VGVYAGGGVALGRFEPGRSDVDVAVVVRSSVSRALKEAIVGAVRHEALPCSARGLELVVYREAVTRTPTPGAAFELNLNSGPGMPFRVDLVVDPAEEHWFPIDRSVLSQHGVALVGPPAAAVFAPIPADDLMRPLAETLRWFARAAPGADAVLNACRAARFAVAEDWTSKAAAAAWGASALVAADVVEAALEARRGGPALDAAVAAGFARVVAEALDPPGGGGAAGGGGAVERLVRAGVLRSELPAP
jgi:hypothetical protein